MAQPLPGDCRAVIEVDSKYEICEIEVVVPSDELAASLPSKTLPQNSKRNPPAVKPPVKKQKPSEDSNTYAGPSRQLQASGSALPKPPVKKELHPIYLFYDLVTANSMGVVNDSKIKLQYSQWACGVEPMTDTIAQEYAVQADSVLNNIKQMFEKQAEDARVPWNQEHFKELLAKWVLVCDQPFMAVTRDEFRELLQYTHHNFPMPLKIPSDDSVKRRIEKMSTEMVEGLKKTWALRPVLRMARVQPVLTFETPKSDPLNSTTFIFLFVWGHSHRGQSLTHLDSRTKRYGCF
ncbi:hypothetical protein C8R44DRAFT_751127 [Mycena epipterygia]|nr:hypothetical protein C8R44DRAFT_751127 [Mycena epipterygia]